MKSGVFLSLLLALPLLAQGAQAPVQATAMNEGDRPVASLPLRPPRAPHVVPGQSPATTSALAPASWVVAHPEYHSNPNCIFCKIIANQAPSRKVFEDDRVLAFWDIKPRVKVHLLVIPKQHVSNLTELEQLPMETRSALLTACAKVAREAGIATSGFRIIVNSGKDASQSVFHLHFHVVGGEPLPADAVRVKATAPSKS